MTVKDLGLGRIIWFGSLIVGITGATLDEKYNECEVSRAGCGGNALDWELHPNSPEMEEELMKQLKEEENGYEEDDEEDGEAW